MVSELSPSFFVYFITPMTLAPETGAINRLDFSAPVSAACVSGKSGTRFVWYQGPCGTRGRCRISPPHFLAECHKRRLNQGSFVSAVCLVVCFL